MDPETITKFDVIRLYDVAVVALLTFVIDNKTIIPVMATAQRPHASASTRQGALRRNDRVPLPSSALRRTSFGLHPPQGFPRRRMIVGYTDESMTRAKVAQPPQPITVGYEFRMLLATPDQQNQLVAQYWQTFIQDKVSLAVDIPEWSEDFAPQLKTTPTLTDNTVDDPVTGDRIYEMSSTLTLEGYVFRPITTVSCVGPRVTVTFEEY